MSRSEIEEKVENYFTSLNSMARRIMIDSNTTKQTLGDKWETLTYQEQCNLLMTEFIKPVVLEKYSLIPSEINSFPKLSICGGEKYVFDDDHGNSKGTSGYSWRDEHSAPFLWETQSQLDIRFSDEEVADSSEPETEQQKANSPVVPQPPVVPCIIKCDASTEAVEEPVSKPTHHKKTTVIQENVPEKMKPKEAVTVPINETNDAGSLADLNLSVDLESPSKNPDIPKTGFDFLDNW